MTLVAVATLETESDVAIAVSVLTAHDIPHFVHNSGFGGLYPGPQIGAYNSRRLMVPASCAADAVAALSHIATSQSDPSMPINQDGFLTKIRIVMEALFLGWFVPRRT